MRPKGLGSITVAGDGLQRWHVVTVLRVVPALKDRRPLVGERLPGLHSVRLAAMLMQRSSEAGQGGRYLRLHVSHHINGVHTRGGWQRQQMLSHAHRGGHQVISVYETVDKTYFVQALGAESKAQSHFSGNWMRQAGYVAVVIAAE